jgi:uncharacterized membrane protein YdcZ (DUF606 family)
VLPGVAPVASLSHWYGGLKGINYLPSSLTLLSDLGLVLSSSLLTARLNV